MILLVIMVALGPLVSDRISYWFYGTSSPIYFWITVICVVATFVSRFLSLILRMQERALAFSMSQVIPKIVFLFVIGLIVWGGVARQFLQLELAFLASIISVLLIYAWNTRKDWIPTWGASIDSAQLRGWLKYSVPLLFSGLAYWGLTATSALTLRSLSTFRELGIYSVSMSVAGVAAIIQTVFTVIWAPVVFKWVANDADMSRVDRVVRQGLAVVTAVFVMFGMFSWLLDYVLPSQYVEVKYLVVCSIAQPLLYTLSEVTSVGVSITRRTMLSLWSTLAALLANLGLNLMLVPRFGASGAVVANAIAYLIFFVARTESSVLVWRRFPRFKLYVFTTGALVLSVLTVALGPTIGWLSNAIWFATLPLVIWAFRDEWRVVARLLQKAFSDLRKEDRASWSRNGHGGRG